MIASKVRRTLLIVVMSVFAVAVMLAANGANAQDAGNGLRISPPRIVKSVFPGSSDRFSIDVTNITNNPLIAVVTTDNFTSDDEAGTPQLVVDENFNPPHSIEPFIGELGNLSLQPGEMATLNVTIDVPPGASPGAYYGLIRFTAVPDELEGASGVALSASVGTIVLIEVPGDIIEAMSLVEIAAARDQSPDISATASFFEGAPDSVVIRLQNDGNSFLQPFGRVTVKDWSGNMVYDYELNDGDPRGNILPDTIRRFENNIENISSFGRYTIEANIGYGDTGGKIISATSTFWVVPWRLILLGVAVVATVTFGATKGIKMYNRRVIAKAKKR